jgi:hypothetical protein
MKTKFLKPDFLHLFFSKVKISYRNKNPLDNIDFTRCVLFSIADKCPGLVTHMGMNYAEEIERAVNLSLRISKGLMDSWIA